MDWSTIKVILETIILVLIIIGALITPWIVQWGRKKLGLVSYEMRIDALEKEDLKIRQTQEMNRVRLAAVEEELRRIEKMDRRLYRLAVMLSNQFPEAAKNLNVLEDL